MMAAGSNRVTRAGAANRPSVSEENMFTQILLGLIFVLILAFLLVLLSEVRFIPNNRIGIVEKCFGQSSVKGGFIALQGEAGYQPDVLRGGLHYRMPFQYVVHIAPFVTIPQGKIGCIFARDGEPLSPMQVLASNIQANNFQDVTSFLKHGCQRRA